MSQLTHPISTFRANRIVVLAGLLAPAATVTVVLVLAIGGSSSGSSDTPVTPSAQQQPGVRYDGGPEEGRSFSAQPPGVRNDGGPEEGRAAQTFGHR